MITNFEINNFRGIRHLTLEELKPITLISGKNNVGKSTILEALFYLMRIVIQMSFQC